MQLKKLIKNFFTANMKYTNNLSYRRVIMINSMLLLSIIVFFIFAYANFTITQNYYVVMLDLIAAISAMATLLDLRRAHNIKRAAILATAIIILFMISFILENKNSHFGIIWSIFIPVLAISFNGKGLGLVFTILFYLIMIPLAYMGIGSWNNGEWAFVDFLRFSIASSLLTYLTYMTESAHAESDIELQIIREREQQTLESVKIQAITDGLTGMYNRRYFNEVVPKLLGIAQRENRRISLFIIDIDHFKNYNDYYGHLKGDETLIKIANELMQFIQREDDFVFRVGGEEFAGIIHTRDKDQSEDWIAQINAKIEALNIEHVRSQTPVKKVTVSIGVCTALVDETKDLTYFYKRADEALYSAKSKGRNCIVTVN